MKKDFIEVAKAVGTHGVRGEVKLEPWCDDAAFLCGFDTLYLDAKGETTLQAKRLRPHKTHVLAVFDGIDTMEAAEALRGKILYIDRKDAQLPEGKWFIQDLIGCKVEDIDTGRCYGTLTAVLTGSKANDVWTVTDQNGKDTLIPAIPSVVAETDLANDVVKIHALRGLFEGIESVIEDEN